MVRTEAEVQYIHDLIEYALEHHTMMLTEHDLVLLRSYRDMCCFLLGHGDDTDSPVVQNLANVEQLIQEQRNNRNNGHIK